MLISKSCQYAVRALIYIYKNTTGTDKRVSPKEISSGVGAPEHFTGKILQTLSKFGFTSSAKGPGGGFYSNEKTPISTVLEIVKAIEGPNFCEQCLLGLPECSDQRPCPAHFTYQKVRAEMHEMFETMTIKDLTKNLNNNEELFRISA